jgi:hypothetical protein
VLGVDVTILSPRVDVVLAVAIGRVVVVAAVVVEVVDALLLGHKGAVAAVEVVSS